MSKKFRDTYKAYVSGVILLATVALPVYARFGMNGALAATCVGAFTLVIARWMSGYLLRIEEVQLSDTGKPVRLLYLGHAARSIRKEDETTRAVIRCDVSYLWPKKYREFALLVVPATEEPRYASTRAVVLSVATGSGHALASCLQFFLVFLAFSAGLVSIILWAEPLEPTRLEFHMLVCGLTFCTYLVAQLGYAAMLVWLGRRKVLRRKCSIRTMRSGPMEQAT